MFRRNFLVGFAGTMLALPGLPEAGRLGVADVERVRAAAGMLRKVDDKQGGARLVAVAVRYIEYVEETARRCSVTGRVRQRLHEALAELAVSTGWFAFDAGNQATARRWWDAALRHALLAQDRVLQARVFSSMSHQAHVVGHGGEAVAIARAALDRTRGRRDGHLSSLLHTRVAVGLAVQGEAGWCARALLRAEQEYDKAPREPQPWLGFYHPGEVLASESVAFSRLGRHHQAVEAARASLKVTERTALTRNLLAARIRLTNTLAAAGETEAALAAGRDALRLTTEVTSPRLLGCLVGFHDEVRESPLEGAAEFSGHFQTALRKTTSWSTP